MAVQETRTLPPQFIEDIGVDLSKQLVAQTGRPVVAPGAGGITQLAGEDAAQFAARQKEAQQFDIRKQSLAGLAPTVVGQDPLQTKAQEEALEGIGSYKPFLDRAQTQAQLASGLGAMSLGQLGTAASTFGGVGTGAQAFQQDVSQFMSPYQSQVIDASLAEFDRNKAIQEKSIADQAIASGAFGGGREGVQRAEFQTGAARERALLQAGLLQQGFGQAQQARQQDIQNRFNLGQAQQGIAGATQGLGSFQSGLAGQQAQFGQGLQQLQGTDVSRLGQLGALNQAQQQAEMDAQREATRMAAFQPQEELNRFADITTGIMGGMRGSGTTTSNVPNPSPLQSALGIGSTIAGIYGAFNK